MNYIKKTIFSYLALIFLVTSVNADDLKSTGKYKDWESFVLTQEGAKICFAQSIPVIRAPKKLKREPSRLFVSFRPAVKMK